MVCFPAVVLSLYESTCITCLYRDRLVRKRKGIDRHTLEERERHTVGGGEPGERSSICIPCKTLAIWQPVIKQTQRKRNSLRGGKGGAEVWSRLTPPL